MFDELNEAKERVDRLERLTRRQAALEAEQRAAKAETQRLKQGLAREQADVDRLERPGLGALLASLFVDTDEKLRKERQEAVAAELKYDGALQREAALAEEQAKVQAELQTLSGAPQVLDRLRRARGAEVERRAGPELQRFTEREQAASRLVKELQEALDAGITADAALQKVQESLSSASTWGAVDMLGGNLITGLIKHSRIDDARAHAHRAQAALSSFRRELQDIQVEIRPEAIGVDGFTRFADFFFDNLLMDWVVQSRIHTSMDGVRESRAQVAGLVDSLSRRLGQAQAELEAVGRERTAFIDRFGPP